MASELGYLTASKLRTDALLDSDDVSIWDDTALEVIITKSEHYAHILGKRAVLDPWTTAEDEYELIQRFVSADARKIMFTGIAERKSDYDNAEAERQELIPIIVSPDQGGEGFSAMTSGANNGKTQSESTTGTFT